MAAIDGLTIEKVANGILRVSFDYSHVVDGFDHALVLVVEQDAIGDNWSLRQRDHIINTSAGPAAAKYLDFYNETYNKFWDLGGSGGPQDDTGRRRFLRRLPAPLGDVRVSFQVRYDPSSPDTEGTSTVPGLEFYAVAVIVSALNGHAGVQLGDLSYSNQLAGA